MKKLKIKLLFSFLIIICFIYCYTYIKLDNSSKYNLSDREFIVKITKINYKDNKTVIEGKGKEKLLINYEGEFDYELGDEIKIIGNLTEPSVNTNFNLFSYKKYLLSKNINYILSAKKIELVKKNNNIFYLIKNKIINKLNNNAYLNAFILGDNSYIEEQIKKSYQVNGISHLFAVSGMHVSFIVSVLTVFLKKIKWYQILLILILLFYSFLTNFSPSILRSVIFFTLCLIKNKFNIKIKTINLFLLMTMSFLVINPYYIYSISFIYSFIISGFLIYFSDKLKEENYFRGLLKISIYSFLFSFPITIYNNFSINLLSPVLNLFFVPLVSLVIFPFSFMVLLCPFLNNIYLFLINILEQISLFCSNIKIFNIIFSKPSIIIILLYYLTIIVVIKNKKFTYFLFIIVIIHYNINFFNSNSKITMLDVGQGDSILLEFPFNQGNILIDTGGKLFDDTNNISNNITIPYLKSMGIKKIDYLILTHGDNDHLGEALNLVNNYKIENVVFNCGDYNNLEKNLIEVLEIKNIKYYSCIKELNIDKYKLQFLNTSVYDNENDNSSVIYTELNNYKFLFTGDASVEVEKNLMEKYNLTNIDVLKVGHHGSKTSSSLEFIEKLNPKYSLISVGKNNRYKHPNIEVLDNLKHSTIYRTDLNGATMFKVNKDKLEIKACT